MWKKIDEVSKLSGVSKRTLQYYDDEGILPVKRSKNNYRLYDDDTMEKLWEILWYKEMGFDLKKILNNSRRRKGYCNRREGK